MGGLLVAILGCSSGVIEESETAPADAHRPRDAFQGPDAREPDDAAQPSPLPDALEVPDAVDADPLTPIDAMPDAYDAGPDAPPYDAGPTGCTPHWVDVLENGDLDLGYEPWIQYSAIGAPVIVEPPELPIDSQTFPAAAWLGGYDGAYDQLWQIANVPLDAEALRIRGQRCFLTEEIDGFWDFATIALLDSGGIPMESITYSNLDAGPDCSWCAFELDAVWSHAGETLILYFEADTDPAAGLTSFFFDSLHLEALVCD